MLMTVSLNHVTQVVWSCLSGIWSWITNGQNATAIGVIAATLLSAFTAFVLLRTLNAINRQAKASDRQAEAAESQAIAARKQTEVSEQLRIVSERAALAAEEQVRAAIASSAVSDAQRKATEDSAKAERAHSELIRHQIFAQLRPVLVLGARPHPTQGGAIETYIENHGMGIALNIRIKLLMPEGSTTQRTQDLTPDTDVLGPSRRALFYYNYRESLYGKIQVNYDSLDGRHFVTTAKVSGSAFQEQKPFEVNERGGWLPEPTIPSVD
jgi:hypothetical protein